MKIKTYLSNKYLRSTLFILLGLLLGWFIFHKPPTDKNVSGWKVSETQNTIWTCAMHPQIRMNHPGKCPICGMDLIPLKQEIAPVDSDAIVMTEEAAKLAEVQTSIVTSQNPVKRVRLYGKIEADERLIQTQPAHVAGRIEKLLVDFTGEKVQKGQVIAQIYSPGLLIAQQELLEAVKMKNERPDIYEVAREKLFQMKFTESQILSIERSGTIQPVFELEATVSGIVIAKMVNVGDYVSLGTPMYQIADLSKVWVVFDAYESDLPWIRVGDRILFTARSQPGKEYTGIVSFIDPVIDPQKRTARIRVEIQNETNNLKPEMFVSGILMARLSGGKSLVIPQSAVLWTGKRSIVYVRIPDTKEPTFKMREIVLGPSMEDSYVVLDGLREGEEVVTNGTFIVDAAAQLAGKPSMMNSEKRKNTVLHDHSGMKM